MSSSEFIDSYRFKIKQSANSLDESILILGQKISNINEKLRRHQLLAQRIDRCHQFAADGSLSASSTSLYPSLNNSSFNPHSGGVSDVTSHLLSLRRRMDQLFATLVTIKTAEKDYVQVREDQEKIKAVAWKIAALQNSSTVNNLTFRNEIPSNNLFKLNHPQNSILNNSMKMSTSVSTSYMNGKASPSSSISDDVPIPAAAPKPNSFSIENKENSNMAAATWLDTRRVNSDNFAAVVFHQSRFETKCPISDNNTMKLTELQTEREREKTREARHRDLVNEERRNAAASARPWSQLPSTRTVSSQDRELLPAFSSNSAATRLSTLEDLGFSTETMELLLERTNKATTTNSGVSQKMPSMSRLNMLGTSTKKELAPTSSFNTAITATIDDQVEDLSTLENLGLSEETMELLGYKCN